MTGWGEYASRNQQLEMQCDYCSVYFHGYRTPFPVLYRKIEDVTAIKCYCNSRAFQIRSSTNAFYPKQLVLIIYPHSVLNILKTKEPVKSVMLLVLVLFYF